MAAKAYQGIQYAVAPRWEEPQDAGLTGTIPVQNYASVCPQVQALSDGSGKAIIGSEQCLHLNIWTPPDAGPNKKYPVMFFIHGGAFVFGSSADGAMTVTTDGAGGGDTPIGNVSFAADGGVYDGTRFAENGVVLVTINYRLGALGFLNWKPDANTGAPHEAVAPVVERQSNKDFDGSSIQPHCPEKITGVCDEPAPGPVTPAAAAALANVVTDFIFRCSNHKFGISVSAGSSSEPVYAYMFTDQSVVAVFGKASGADQNLCNQSDATANMFPVCHGYELPFVFNTIATTANLATVVDKSSSVYQSALSVAEHMNQDWASFAKSPGGFSPSSGTGGGSVYDKAFSGDDGEKLFVSYGDQDPWYNPASSENPSGATFDDGANCGGLWFGTASPNFPPSP